jgi:imidazolonepropionase-like amidohydrolase
MKPTFVAAVLLFAAGCAARTSETPSPSSSSVPIAFVEVDVLPMDSERVLKDQTVVISGDRIVTLGSSSTVSLSEGTTRVDARGKYLMPGLAEMHGHIPPPTAPREFTEAVLFLYVANGITTVRGMLGAPGQLELREKAKRGEILAPTLYLAGPSFSGNSINSPQEAIGRVRQQKAEGWDLLKVHPGLTREEYDAMARTARELGIRFAGHVPGDVGLLHAIEVGQETFDHLDGYIEYLEGDKGPLDQTKLAEAVRRTREAGAWVVPTMVLWETLLGTADLKTLQSHPELKYMPAEQVEQWTAAFESRLKSPQFKPETARRVAANRLQLLKSLQDGGVRILMGTDSPQQFSVPGFSIHRELRRMADAGLTPYEILVSGTRNVGDYFKNQDTFGRIEAGQRADLILLEANPLDDVGNIAKRAGVMVRGQWLPESEIQSRLAAIEASNRKSGGRPAN